MTQGNQTTPFNVDELTTYDQMSTAERQRVVEALGNLAGLQEGPGDAFPDGTHYEMTLNSKEPESRPGRTGPKHLLNGDNRHIHFPNLYLR
jgi:hypothetical protein